MRRAKKGKFLVIEGSDGTGKTAQLKLLIRRLRREGHPVRTIHFPQHGKPSSYFVDRYLNDVYGPAAKLGYKKASLFYALDRFEAATQIRKWLREGYVVVADRYIGSNMGHQGSKIPVKRERLAYFKWLYDLEYQILGIPKPDANIVLNMPARIAYRLIGEKLGEGRGYLRGKKRDGHEQSLKFLARSDKTYREITRLFPRDFVGIECAARGKLFTIPIIHEIVWKTIKKEI